MYKNDACATQIRMSAQLTLKNIPLAADRHQFAKEYAKCRQLVRKEPQLDAVKGAHLGCSHGATDARAHAQRKLRDSFPTYDFDENDYKIDEYTPNESKRMYEMKVTFGSSLRVREAASP